MQSTLEHNHAETLLPPRLNRVPAARPASRATPSPKGKVVVFGILFFYPLAGVTYQFLHYLLGLRRLGYDVYYVEDSSRWVFDYKTLDSSPDPSANLAIIAPILERYGFKNRWAFRGNYPGGGCYGLTEGDLKRLYREADCFLNVTGAQELRSEHLEFRRRIYVESDPFSTQARVAQGDKTSSAMLVGHDTLFSFGENIGAPDCTVPVGESRWHQTRQPVVMELWRSASTANPDTYRTITTWHNKVKDVTYKGEKFYWTKDREFERFLDLPQRRAVNFELATSVPQQVRERLTGLGWKLADSVHISQDLARYTDYIQSSRAEFTVARDQYVRPRTGWFSDRSACFLAAGRPVITQETGFSKFLPTGKGLFGFETMDDILAAVDEIESDYEGNCRAASDIAENYFAAEKVLASLMQRAGL